MLIAFLLRGAGGVLVQQPSKGCGGCVRGAVLGCAAPSGVGGSGFCGVVFGGSAECKVGSGGWVILF